MRYNVHLTKTFEKSLKTLKKKYRNIKDDLLEMIRELEMDPSIGSPIPGWEKEVWKIRIASSDIKRGKRGGFRLIYFWKEREENIYLLTVYFKGAKVEITEKEIESMLNALL